MNDPREAARIEAEARAKVIWPTGSAELIAQAEEALRTYFLAKGVTAYFAATSSRLLEAELDYEESFGPPMPANDFEMPPYVPTAEDIAADVWDRARDVAWRSVAENIATLDGGPPWEFDVELDYDRKALLAAQGEEDIGKMYNRIKSLSDEERERLFAEDEGPTAG